MKRKLSSLLLIFIIALTISSCAGREKLLFLNWGEYIDESLITAFENKYNCDVVMDLGDSNEIFYSKVRAGTTVYDVICPSDYMVEKMYRNNMLLKIDFDKYGLTAYKNQELIAPVKAIYEEMHKQTSDVDKENETISDYSTPYLCGTWGIMYSTEVSGLENTIKNEKNSWSILFDRSKTPVGTKIAMYDSSIHAYYAACKYFEDEGLDFNTYEELPSSKLSQIKDLVKGVKFDAWGNDNIKKDIVAGNLDIGFMWTGDFLYYYCENATETVLNAYTNNDAKIDELINVLNEITKDDGEYNINGKSYSIGFDLFIPNDTIAFCDNLVISNQSSNQELAHKFIDFMISNSITVNDVEYTPAYSNTYYVDYNTPYLSVYNKIIDLKYSNPETKELLTLTQEDEDLFKEEIKSTSISNTTLYSTIYDYVTSIAFGKYYDKDIVKGNILSAFPRTYINSINTTFNNARA
mgnify:FL=1